jgi:DNA-binding PadR family transcriptional regulator
MTRKPLSLAATTVLLAISERVRHGFDIMDATRLPSGTVYPALARLENAGLISGSWEEFDDARAGKRPPRRYYRITAEGRTALAEAVARHRSLGGLLPPEPWPGEG